MSNRGPFVLGIDCGTQSLRAAAFDLAGSLVGCASHPCAVEFPRVGWAEQRAESWWEAARRAVPRCLAEGGLRPDAVAGISVDCTSCTVIAATRDGTPLRPAILWMDQRAHEEAAEIAATGHPRLRYAGATLSAEWMLPKTLWLKRHEPRVFDQAELMVEGIDWLTHRLTGEWALSLNSVTCRWNYIQPEGGWSEDLLEQAGLPELRAKWPEAVRAMGEPVGELTREAAEALGLRAGTPVAEGGIDAYTSMLGVGAVRPGRMALVMGSSTCHLAVCAEAAFGSRLWGPFPECLLPGTWVLEGGQTATGSIVKWFADHLAGAVVAQAPAGGRGAYEALDREAALVGVGSEGLILLDYFQGNRTPIGDPLARGAIWGLSLKHGSAHLLRAIYEGTAFGARLILDDMRRAGYAPESIYACGGGSRSTLWLQIHADVCQAPIHLTQAPEATALGAAICAAVGAGLFAHAAEASEAMTRVTQTIEPSRDAAAEYDFCYDKYVRTYAALRDLMHEVAARGERGGPSGPEPEP